jgi:hypothetical protein
MNNMTCGIVTVVIGREFSINPLLNYFKELDSDDFHLNLYIVLGCDSEFTDLVKNKINELNLYDKYKNINFINGVDRCEPHLNWSEWENLSRKTNPEVKHRAALENINIGLNESKYEDYIHFVDDDTIPPPHALKDLLKTHNKINNCGIASGLYFNKVWVEPTIAVGVDEANRRVVASIEKSTWQGASIDNLSISDYYDIGFVGNGCILMSGHDTKRILPLTEYREQNDDIAPPDFIICRRIRRMGKLISIAPSVTPQHLNEVGEPIGLTPNYLQSVKDSSEYPKILVLTYNSFLNYSKLSQYYDEVLVINHKEINNDVSFLEKYDNIKVINRSIIDTCVKYDYYKNYSELKGESMKYAILEEIHKYISNKTAYIIYLYNERNNTIRRIPFLDSRNLKKFLNTKP